MHKKLWTFVLLAGVATGAFAMAACSSDNTAGGSSTSSSGGPGTDGGDGGNVTNPDGGDGGCTFAGFVIGLVNSPSNGTPSTDLGDSCTPSTSTDDFKSLFP